MSKMLYKRFVEFSHKYKIIRGMLSYGLLYPCGCLAEQTLVEKKNFKTYDWKKCFKYLNHIYFSIKNSKNKNKICFFKLSFPIDSVYLVFSLWDPQYIVGCV